MANWSKSGSKSETWEGIEGYQGKFIDIGSLNQNQEIAKQKPIKAATGAELAALYGFLSGDGIDKRYKDAVDAKYNEIDGTIRKARDTSQNDMAVGLDSYNTALRNQRMNAAQTGIARGSNVASEIGMMMNNQKTMSESQQGYADAMAKAGLERGTAAYEGQINAMKDRNNVANQLGALGMQKYGFDVQDNASYMSYLAQMDANRVAQIQASAAWNASEGQNTRRKTSESSSWQESYDNSADIAAEAQRYAADRQAATASANAGSNREAFDGAMQAAMNMGLDKDQAYLYAMGLDYGGLPGKESGVYSGNVIAGAGLDRSPYASGKKPSSGGSGTSSPKKGGYLDFNIGWD